MNPKLSFGLPTVPLPTVTPPVPLSFSNEIGRFSPSPVGPPISASSMSPAVSPVMSPTRPMERPAGLDVTPGGAAEPFSMGGMLKSTFLTEGGGINLDALGTLTKGIGALGSVWAGMKANGIAQDSLDFQKRAYKTNLTNQIGSFNMALEDRARARAAQNNASDASAQAYIDKHKMKA